MILTERHQIKGSPEIIKLCTTSKELYNKCNYHMRKQWFYNLKNNNWDNPLPNISQLYKMLKEELSFKNFHNVNTSTQIIRKCLSDWSNFQKALKVYNKNKTAFTGKPKPPKYKDKLAQVIFFSRTIKGGRSKNRPTQLTPTNDLFIINSNKDFKQVIITPKTFGFIIEVSYEVQTKTNNEKGYEFIDLGVNNLCTITSDQHAPILINGRILKSINQFYNKYPNKNNLRKRYFRIENYCHHTSRFIINNCLKNKVGTIVIGKNDGWKQEVKQSKKNKQNFIYIPFDKLIQKIKYKAELEGIKVILTEEAYTSKSSYLDNDPLPKYQKDVKHIFSGKRIRRGLYKSKDGIILNADVNGSLNIGRKVIGEAIYGLVDRSLVARPIRVNPLKISA